MNKRSLSYKSFPSDRVDSQERNTITCITALFHNLMSQRCWFFGNTWIRTFIEIYDHQRFQVRLSQFRIVPTSPEWMVNTREMFVSFHNILRRSLYHLLLHMTSSFQTIKQRPDKYVWSRGELHPTTSSFGTDSRQIILYRVRVCSSWIVSPDASKTTSSLTSLVI